MNECVLRITPIGRTGTNAFIKALHRHHKPSAGAKFYIAVSDEQNQIRGVAAVGRPVARHMDDGWTLEVNRCCTDGARNACSMLYGAAWRIAKEMGFKRLITYTLPEEGGASMRGVGWHPVDSVGGTPWTNREGRSANEHTDGVAKVRWEVSLDVPDYAPPEVPSDEPVPMAELFA